jgi:hypothetical protein
MVLPRDTTLHADSGREILQRKPRVQHPCSAVLGVSSQSSKLTLSGSSWLSPVLPMGIGVLFPHCTPHPLSSGNWLLWRSLPLKAKRFLSISFWNITRESKWKVSRILGTVCGESVGSTPLASGNHARQGQTSSAITFEKSQRWQAPQE